MSDALAVFRVSPSVPPGWRSRRCQTACSACARAGSRLAEALRSCKRICMWHVRTTGWRRQAAAPRRARSWAAAVGAAAAAGAAMGAAAAPGPRAEECASHQAPGRSPGAPQPCAMHAAGHTWAGAGATAAGPGAGADAAGPVAARGGCGVLAGPAGAAAAGGVAAAAAAGAASGGGAAAASAAGAPALGSGVAVGLTGAAATACGAAAGAAGAATGVCEVPMPMASPSAVVGAASAPAGRRRAGACDTSARGCPGSAGRPGRSGLRACADQQRAEERGGQHGCPRARHATLRARTLHPSPHRAVARASVTYLSTRPRGLLPASVLTCHVDRRHKPTLVRLIKKLGNKMAAACFCSTQAKWL